MARSPIAKDLKPDGLRPYLAPVLLQSVGRKTDARLLNAVIDEIENGGIKSTGRVVRKLVRSVSMGSESGLRFHSILYSEEVAPAWMPDGTFKNLTYELIVVAARGENIAICASDGVSRDRILKQLKAARPMPPSALAGFVGAEAAAIWLNGVHTPTAVKANTKMLTGTSLEYALDPLGDQTYRYSAIRSRPDVPGLKDAQDRTPMVGAAPDGARVWVGRPENWPTFAEQLAAILDHALSKRAGVDLYAFLAQPVGDAAEVKDAFAIAVVPQELLSEDAIDEKEHEEARRWAYDARFEIVARNGMSLDVEPYLDGKRLGRVSLSVSLAGGVVDIAAEWTYTPKGSVAKRAQCAAFLTDTDKVKIYYDSGHTIMQGRCYVMACGADFDAVGEQV